MYEKKLQKLLDEPAAEQDAPTDVTTLPKVDSNQNGNTNSDQYSDKEDGEFWSHLTTACCRTMVLEGHYPVCFKCFSSLTCLL